MQFCSSYKKIGITPLIILIMRTSTSTGQAQANLTRITATLSNSLYRMTSTTGGIVKAFLAALLIAGIVQVCTEYHNPANSNLQKLSTNKTLAEDEITHAQQPNILTTQDGGATGELFTGGRIRTYSGPWKFSNNVDTNSTPEDKVPDNCQLPVTGKYCSQWAVVTTIHSLTDAVKRVTTLKHWCTVIVADTKTPTDYLQQLDNCKENSTQHAHVVFLSLQAQRQFNNCFVEAMPFQSFARKNIGYLYAVRHGAKVIFDFDDDNILKSRADENSALTPISPWTYQPKILASSIRVQVKYPLSNKTSFFINPYPYMGASVNQSWPRGFPIEEVRALDLDEEIYQKTLIGDVPLDHVAVIQFLADKNPDVDAVYRLTQPLPLTFDDKPVSLKMIVPREFYAPYNAQATLHFSDVFWGLLLPKTVSGRVSDIWRSFITQCILKKINMEIVFAPPIVAQERNEHNYIADMDAEWDLYMKTHPLVNFLSSSLAGNRM